ncbi:nuclear transport factor 2 family protein [Ktedonosporobacter rubrisoli]|nr:nuclear transport factor 2 family protein [Ktedonosporobacter rubrisoli]
MTEERLQAFAEAWARHDVDMLMTFLTEDCIYEASVGPEPGKTYKGREAVRQGMLDMLAYDGQGESRGGPIDIFGEKGVAQWSYVWTEPDGRVIELRGCDIYEFRGDKISRKNAFRKAFQ